jgi:hypothetical protein
VDEAIFSGVETIFSGDKKFRNEKINFRGQNDLFGE